MNQISIDILVKWHVHVCQIFSLEISILSPQYTNGHVLKQGGFWLENKIAENQCKIAETIYIPFQNSHFLPVLTVSSNFRKIIFREK
jgi:hypothetical protein